MQIIDDNTRHCSAVAKAFTVQSDQYSAYFIPTKSGAHYCFRKRLELVMEMTADRKGALLDCAVGPGEITTEVLRRGGFDRATLIDISSAMIAKTNQRQQSSLPDDVLAGVESIIGDVFQVSTALKDRQFDLILCLGLIAHTGRLNELLSKLKSLLSVDGKIILQSSMLNHWGTKAVRCVSSRRYARLNGYALSYFRDRDIEQACLAEGLRIVSSRRFCAGIPFGDKVWPQANYHLERLLSPLASRVGAEVIYLLERNTAE